MLVDLLDLVLPPRCAGCDRPGAVACDACLATLLGDPAPRPPVPPPAGLPQCWSATTYRGAARRMILAGKERGRTAVLPILAACVAEVAVAALGPRSGPALLVPVPSTRAAARGRGHDPVRTIAGGAAAALRRHGLAVTAVPLLQVVGRVADQAGLSSARRAANLSGAFRVVPGRADALRSPAGRRVVLVDDIVTTGSTLAEAARAVRAAGAEVPLAVTVAATPRRNCARPTGRLDRMAGRDRT